MADYRLVFDAASNGYQTWRAAILPASISVAVLVLLTFLRSIDSIEARDSRFYRGIFGAVGALATVGCAAMLVHTPHEYNLLRTSLRNRTFRVVDGQVTDFVPQGSDGHPIERFRVNGVPFEYSQGDITSGFHLTAADGGPIRNGMIVRIADMNGAIARLEIR